MEYGKFTKINETDKRGIRVKITLLVSNFQTGQNQINLQEEFTYPSWVVVENILYEDEDNKLCTNNKLCTKFERT